MLHTRSFKLNMYNWVDLVLLFKRIDFNVMSQKKTS